MRKLGLGGHLIVRKDGVLCTRCLKTDPVHPGDGTPLPAYAYALEQVLKRHPPHPAKTCALPGGI